VPLQSTAPANVHRIETTRMLIQRVQPRALPPRAEDAARPVAPEPAPQPQIPAELATAGASEQPSIAPAEPLAGAPPLVRQQPAPESPPLVIEIGRIDIRIASETLAPPAVVPRRDTGAVPSLEDYLARRSEARR
jgi:hypothetical protein